MNPKIKILVLFVCLNATNLFAQREANIWYFGAYAGLNFNSGNPQALLDGQINRWEGVASFSDTLGNLLFYTDGETVWNRFHEIMPNGTGLHGNQGSTESAIITPYPENDSLFYIFTVDWQAENNGFCYSLVNLNLDNGNGDITDEKNIQLLTPVSEKITAIKHANDTNIWVITHEWLTDSFYVYLITNEGLNTVPIINEIGQPHDMAGNVPYNSVGYMRTSPDGSRIASVLPETQIIEVFDFDNETGIISNPITINDREGSGYGVEFSPDASKLYFTSGYELVQVDLSAETYIEILNSYTVIDSSLTNTQYGALQLATNGKIYMAKNFSEYLGVINNPGLSGQNCNFQLDGCYLEGRISRLGLPNFIPTYFLPPDFVATTNCVGDSTEFFIPDVSEIDSVLWDFGDTQSGDENFSKLLNPKHLYSEAGNYLVILKVYNQGIEFIRDLIIIVYNLPEISLGNDTILCLGDSIILNAYITNCEYLWNNASTDSILSVKQAGEYWVHLINTFTTCENSDTITITHKDLPNFSLGNDTSFCKNDSLQLEVFYENAEYLWNTNSHENSIVATEIGEYWLQITDIYGCKNRDTILLSNYNLPEIFLGNDTIICPETKILLDVYQKNAKYLWNDSSINHYLVVNSASQYFVELTDSLDCKNSDTINISAKLLPEFSLGNDTIICDNETLKISVNLDNTVFLWTDNSTDSNYVVDTKGFHWLKATNICGSVIDSIYVEYIYCGEIHIPNVFTPNEDNINDYFFIKGIEDEIWKLEIYNRWGNLIFETNHYLNDWNGDNCSDGVYYYIFSNSEFNIVYKGFVHIYN